MANVSMWHQGGKDVKLFAKFDLSPPDWHREAACTPDDIPLLSPEFTSTRESVADEVARIVAAKRICRDCPVATQCLDDADRNRHQEGIWGGMSEYERPYTEKARLYQSRDDDESREVRVMRAVRAAELLASLQDRGEAA